jgi:hypothetical protein
MAKGKKDPRFERSNNEMRDKFIERLKKDIDGLEFKEFDSGAKINPIEFIVRYKNRNIVHIANRANMYFCLGIKQLSGKNDIRKLMSEKDIEKAFNDLKNLTVEIDKLPAKSNKKPNKKSTPAKPDDEIIAVLKERIAKLDKKSKGIKTADGEMTKAVRKWAKQSGFTITGNTIIVKQVE